MAVLPNIKQVVRVKGAGLQDLHEAMRLLVHSELLVGFPEDTTERPADDSDVPGETPPTNAELAYIHDRGAPEVNIPARPFMFPAMDEVKDRAANKLGAIGKSVLRDRSALKVTQGLHQLGLMASVAIKRKINEGIPPPLSEWTLMERARRGRKGAKKELANRAVGIAPSTQLAKPLIDTGELRKSASYVIRPRKARR